MNTQPIFRDQYGKPIASFEKSKRRARARKYGWRAYVAFLMVIGLPPLLAAATTTAIDLTKQVMNILAVANGGTGVSSSTAHGVIVGEGSSALGVTAAGTSGQPLLSGGSAADPAYGTVAPAAGGLGTTTNTAHGVLLGEGTSNVVATAPTGNSQCYMSAASSGTTTDPGFTTCPSAPNSYEETPSGSVNGSNTSFTLAHTPTSASSVLLMDNGLGLTQGSTSDYTISGATITTNYAPATGHALLAYYH